MARTIKRVVHLPKRITLFEVKITKKKNKQINKQRKQYFIKDLSLLYNLLLKTNGQRIQGKR